MIFRKLARGTTEAMEILPYALVYTNPGTTAVTQVQVTDVLPPLGQGTYVPGSADGTGGVYDAATNTLNWTIASVAPGESVTLSYQLRVGSEVRNDDLILNTARLTFAGWTTQASATVRVIGKYRVTLAIYNEAGELIKVVSTLELAGTILSFDVMDPVIRQEGDISKFIYNGKEIGSWDGTDEEGHIVTSGEYYVKIDNVDPYNVTTSVTRSVAVQVEPMQLGIVVYNEAGEIVRTIAQEEIENMLGGRLLQSDYSVSGAQFSPTVIRPSYSDPTGQGRYVLITLGSGRSIVWDGRNDLGEIVKNGQYYIEIRSLLGTRTEDKRVVDVAVQAGDEMGTVAAVLAPNPVNLGRTDEARFMIRASQLGVDQVVVRLYAVSGELVLTLHNLPGRPEEVPWRLKGAGSKTLATGTYIAVVDLKKERALVGQKVLKVMLLR
jgi:uncharacterized repeat protein (TIGR01451 family)